MHDNENNIGLRRGSLGVGGGRVGSHIWAHYFCYRPQSMGQGNVLHLFVEGVSVDDVTSCLWSHVLSGGERPGSLSEGGSLSGGGLFQEGDLCKEGSLSQDIPPIRWYASYWNAVLF